MLVRSLVVVGAIGVAAALMVSLRSGDDSGAKPPRDKHNNARDTAGIPGKSAHATRTSDFDPSAGAGSGAVRPRPELTVAPPEASRDGFASESRDDSWAPAKEREVGERVEKVLTDVLGDAATKVRVDQVECRSRSCRMHVTGDDAKSFTTFVEALQDSRGFYGRASLLMLDSYKPASIDNPQPTVNVILEYR